MPTDILVYILSGVIVILLAVIFGIVKYKSFKDFISKIVTQVEQSATTEKGQEKLKKAIELIRKNSTFSKFLSDETLTALINTTVKIFNSFTK